MIKFTNNILSPYSLTLIAFVLILPACSGTKEIATDTTSENSDQAEVIDSSIAENAPDAVNEQDSLRSIAIEEYKIELTEEYGSKANVLTSFYINAQQRFYNGDYQNALLLVNKALAIQENADALALKGSIYLGLGSLQGFTENWRKALEMDPEIPIPPAPAIVRQLQETGLIDQNLKRNF